MLPYTVSHMVPLKPKVREKGGAPGTHVVGVNLPGLAELPGVNTLNSSFYFYYFVAGHSPQRGCYCAPFGVSPALSQRAGYPFPLLGVDGIFALIGANILVCPID